MSNESVFLGSTLLFITAGARDLKKTGMGPCQPWPRMGVRDKFFAFTFSMPGSAPQKASRERLFLCKSDSYVLRDSERDKVTRNLPSGRGQAYKARN